MNVDLIHCYLLVTQDVLDYFVPGSTIRTSGVTRLNCERQSEILEKIRENMTDGYVCVKLHTLCKCN